MWRDCGLVFVDGTDAGIPEALLQKRKLAGASCSTLAQMSFLNGSFSGPCSCTISAFLTASESVVAMQRRFVEKS